ncbi:esterase/lipase family protein [Puniceicoccus vermicola]
MQVADSRNSFGRIDLIFDLYEPPPVRRSGHLWLWGSLLFMGFAAIAQGRDAVILLHGLARSSSSMEKMEEALAEEGYRVFNIDYPSSTASIEELSETAMAEVTEDPDFQECSQVHFVTHSMGGILVRSYLSGNELPKLGRVVMLAPPNQGSEVVDEIGDWWIFEKINGPAGKELGTDEDSTPNQLGPVDFELGIIAGDRSVNWINSTMIEGPDDGKVSVEFTKVEGMKEHIVIHATHPFIMNHAEVIEKTILFLQTGSFED